MWLGHVPWAGLLGLALSHRAGALGTLLPAARTPPQKTHRLGAPNWLPQRSLVLVGDGGYAVLDLLHCCQSLAQPVTLIARLRLDAALYEPAPPRQRSERSASAERPTAARAETPGLAHRVMGRGVGSLVQLAGSPRKLRSGTAREPPVPIRWVLVRDPQGEFATQCTDAVDPKIPAGNWR